MKLVLIGARADGQAHVTLDLIDEAGEHEVVGFLDETPELWETRVHGLPVLGPPTAIDRAQDLGALGGVVSIGCGRARERFSALLEKAGLEQPNLVHPRAYVAPSARLGSGVFVGVDGVVSSGASIGDQVLLGPTALVSHHAVVGAGTTLSPGARLAGRSRLGRRVFVGMGATVLPDRTVGDDATIGAATIVNRDIPTGGTVQGLPGRQIPTR